MTVTVTGSGATPTGTVTLSGGGYTSAATTLSGGSANIVIPANSLSAGSDTLTVSYSGDSNYAAASGAKAGTAPVKVSATPLAPTVTVTPSGNHSGFGFHAERVGRSDRRWSYSYRDGDALRWRLHLNGGNALQRQLHFHYSCQQPERRNRHPHREL